MFEMLNSDSPVVQPIISAPLPTIATQSVEKFKDSKKQPLKVTRRRRNSNRINNITLDDNASVTSSDTSKRYNEQPANNSANVRQKARVSTADEEDLQYQNYVESESFKDDDDDECDEGEVSDEAVEMNSDAILNLEQCEQEKIIENEIEQLRKENSLLTSNKKKKSTNPLLITNNRHSSSCSSFLSPQHTASTINNQELVASSLKASIHFNKKIEDLENYSNIIENATNAMDSCFKDINNVYTGFGESSSTNDEDGSAIVINEAKLTNDDIIQPLPGVDLDREEIPIKETTETDSNSESDFYKSSLNQIDAESITTTSENQTKDFSNLSQIENNYLAIGTSNEIKYEIK